MKLQATKVFCIAICAVAASSIPLRTFASSTGSESTAFILNLYLYDSDSKARGLASTIFLDDQFSYDYANHQAMIEFGHRFYCPPGNIVLTPDQIASLLTHYLEKHPEAGRAPLHETIFKTLKESFPCK